jgi:hypothetical protein
MAWMAFKAAGDPETSPRRRSSVANSRSREAFLAVSRESMIPLASSRSLWRLTGRVR